MNSRLTVVYDACVLYPAPLRDFFMHLALTNMFRAKWSNLIHDEWIRNVLKKRSDLSKNILDRTRHLMDTCVIDCIVEDFEHLIKSIDLPDNDDRHVVAASIHSSADRIITFNLKDFPTDKLERYNLTAQHPDDFILELIDIHSAKVCQAAANHRRSLRNPPKTVDEYLDTLLNQGLMKSVNTLKQSKIAL